jgi:hypothetical protein
MESDPIDPAIDPAIENKSVPFSALFCVGFSDIE